MDRLCDSCFFKTTTDYESTLNNIFVKWRTDFFVGMKHVNYHPARNSVSCLLLMSSNDSSCKEGHFDIFGWSIEAFLPPIRGKRLFFEVQIDSGNQGRLSGIKQEISFQTGITFDWRIGITFCFQFWHALGKSFRMVFLLFQTATFFRI